LLQRISRTGARLAIGWAAAGLATLGWPAAVGLGTLGWPAAALAEAPAPQLAFGRDGETLRSLPLPELRARCDEREVRVPDDPYYGRPMRFRACPLSRVLELGFGKDLAAPADAEFLLRAKDGYTRASPVALLSSPDAYLAFADAERLEAGLSSFASIDRRQLDPGPAYLVWAGTGQADVNAFPWPYQLVSIEISSVERRFPHVVPQASADGSARAGFAIFRRECLSCHAVNGQGGSVGPDLNVPRSIVEYRPPEQIKDYIRDPSSFRYTSMPSHPHLTDGDLEGLLAYFAHMSQHKRDPGGPRH
jgi:mono/diheme cytochrome c family protein